MTRRVLLSCHSCTAAGIASVCDCAGGKGVSRVSFVSRELLFLLQNVVVACYASSERGVEFNNGNECDEEDQGSELLVRDERYW